MFARSVEKEQPAPGDTDSHFMTVLRCPLSQLILAAAIECVRARRSRQLFAWLGSTPVVFRARSGNNRALSSSLHEFPQENFRSNHPVVILQGSPAIRWIHNPGRM